MQRAGQPHEEIIRPLWVLRGLIAVWISPAGSHSHLKDGPPDVNHAADEQNTQNHGQRKQNEAGHRLREQIDPCFELIEGHGHKRSDHEHRNGDSDGKPEVQLHELSQVTQGRDPVLKPVKHEAQYLGRSFDG